MPRGVGTGEQARILLCQIRAPSGFSGAFFTRRDTHTLPFIWAGPLTSTEKGFFQACLAANCWVDWRAAQMKERPARMLPPLPAQGAGPCPVDLRPQPPPSFLCPQRPEGQTQPPTPLAGGPGTDNWIPGPHPTSHLLLLLLPDSGCQVSGRPGSMKQSIVRLR